MFGKLFKLTVNNGTETRDAGNPTSRAQARLNGYDKIKRQSANDDSDEALIARGRILRGEPTEYDGYTYAIEEVDEE